MNLKEELAKSIARETKLSFEEINSQISNPPNPNMGDFAFACFKLGNPHEEALKLKEKIKLPKSIEKAVVEGPYLNFFLDHKEVARELLTTILKEKKNYGKSKSKKKIVIEYCGPNTNKPLHLGHVRNMALGKALCNTLEFSGNKVHPVNIINDRGVHICQSMLAYQKWSDNQQPNKKGDHFVGDYYVLFANKVKENPQLKEEVQKMLQLWEANDKEVRKLWKKMNSWVLEGFAQTYNRFGISFEKEYFESKIYEKGKEVAQEGLKKGVFIKDKENAIVAPLEKFNLPNKVVLRADGTSIYITQDMYLAKVRYQDYKFDKMFYVVASEQRLHFQQLFKILELLGNSFAKNLNHLSYGLVNLPTGRMKSREGTVVDADDLLDEMSKVAQKEVRARYQNLSEKEIQRRAEIIGLAAIKFFMLRTDATRDIVFNPEESISFEGETGPYIQYAYARACSILRKAKDEKKQKKTNITIEDPLEKRIISQLLLFPSLMQEVERTYKIHLICRYLLDLSQAFNEFYHACPVLIEDDAVRSTRLKIVEAVTVVLSSGLSLLGIEAPQEM